jgi:hypothetical protein
MKINGIKDSMFVLYYVSPWAVYKCNPVDHGQSTEINSLPPGMVVRWIITKHLFLKATPTVVFANIWDSHVHVYQGYTTNILPINIY